MYHLALAALALLFGSCGPPADPDTIPNKSNTFKMGGSDYTQAMVRNLAAPRYLPAWAPVSPGAKLRTKVLVRQKSNVVRRGTTYHAGASFEDVTRFYDQFYANRNIRPTKVFSAQYGKIYYFSKDQSVDFVNVQKFRTPSGGWTIDVTFVQAACR